MAAVAADVPGVTLTGWCWLGRGRADRSWGCWIRFATAGPGVTYSLRSAGGRLHRRHRGGHAPDHRRRIGGRVLRWRESGCRPASLE